MLFIIEKACSSSAPFYLLRLFISFPRLFPGREDGCRQDLGEKKHPPPENPANDRKTKDCLVSPARENTYTAFCFGGRFGTAAFNFCRMFY